MVVMFLGGAGNMPETTRTLTIGRPYPLMDVLKGEAAGILCGLNEGFGGSYVFARC